MTTAKQLEANRRNAGLSTGPRTANGKAKVARNALRHGVHSDLPVLPGLERAEDWEAHRDGILQSLAPVGTLEETLAQRVALCAWRLQRAARYEAAITAVGLERAEQNLQPRPPAKSQGLSRMLGDEGEDEDSLSLPEALGKVLAKLEKKQQQAKDGDDRLRLLEQLAELPDGERVGGDGAWLLFEDLHEALPEGNKATSWEDRKFLAAVGVPNEEQSDAYAWDGWTAGMVRQGLSKTATETGRTPERLLERACTVRREKQEEAREAIHKLRARAKDLRRRLAARRDQAVRECLLPDVTTLQKVTRYEAHLSRQMTQALHELQRLQAARAGQQVPPPAALDVTLDAGGDVVDALRDAVGG
jgi:hypothetical protein